MDFNLKQWRYQQLHESDLKLEQQQEEQEQEQVSAGSSALPLFVPQVTSKQSSSSLSPDHSTTTSTRLPKMGSSSYFSLGQWQELELQALIFRHMLAGASVPPQLLNLVKKSLLINNNSSPSPHYLPYPLQHYSQYHPALMQSGYWGRAAMDPELGRCRRTDGKKWRCSRDVVAGHKYCERHVHRGRNRSRKPVEIPTPPAAAGGGGSNGGARGSGGSKTNIHLAAKPLASGTHFDLSESSPSIDLLHFNQRSSGSRTQNNGPFETQKELSEKGNSGAGVLRHFFDDWPRSLQESGRAQSNGSPDFSLKLSTGHGDGLSHQEESARRDGVQLSWAGGYQVAPMGGPLAEALRSSSTSNSSPTSVLHQLARGSTLETSYIST